MATRRRKPSSRQRSKTPHKETGPLSPPSQDLAKRILTEVGWEERIEGFFEAPMRGNMRELVYSFRDAANLLMADVSDPWSTRSGLLGYFEFNELQAWIRDVFGDKELAHAIAEVIKDDRCLKEQIESIKALMNYRLRQCEELLS